MYTNPTNPKMDSDSNMDLTPKLILTQKLILTPKSGISYKTGFRKVGSSNLYILIFQIWVTLLCQN